MAKSIIPGLGSRPQRPEGLKGWLRYLLEAVIRGCELGLFTLTVFYVLGSLLAFFGKPLWVWMQFLWHLTFNPTTP